MVPKEKEGWVKPGGAPLFLAKDEEEQKAIALYLSRTLKAMVHELGNGVLFLVRH